VGILFGSIFGVDAPTAWVIAGIGAATSVALLAMARPLLFATLDPEVARARGLPVRLLDALFLTLLGITVAEAVPAVGALLVFALLVTPAASIRKLVMRPFLGLALSALLALLITWAGLTMAFYLSYPVSFDISMLGFVIYLVVLFIQRVRARTRQSGSAFLTEMQAAGERVEEMHA
jgi:zinc/manganese transport system permease protein